MAPNNPSYQSRVISVTGPYGSTGKTTVAINLALELTADKNRVLLIDADLAGASIANHFLLADLPAGLIGAIRIANQNRFDLEQLERLSVRLQKSNLTILSTGPQTSNPEITPNCIENILATSREHFDFIIIDVGSLCSSWADKDVQSVTAGFVDQSDELVAVALADPIGVFRLLASEDLLLQLATEPRLLVNRLRNSVISQAKSEIIQTLDRLGKIPISYFLPDDQGHLDQALKVGVPAAMLSRSGGFRQALSSFTRTVLLERSGELDSRLAKLG